MHNNVRFVWLPVKSVVYCRFNVHVSLYASLDCVIENINLYMTLKVRLQKILETLQLLMRENGSQKTRFFH